MTVILGKTLSAIISFVDTSAGNEIAPPACVRLPGFCIRTSHSATTQRRDFVPAKSASEFENPAPKSN